MKRLYFLEKRVHQKMDDYETYSFTDRQDAALRAFFDLSQEYESTEDLYCICVVIVKAFFDLDAKLYAMLNGDSLRLVCTSHQGLIKSRDEMRVPPIMVYSEAEEHQGSCFFPVIGNKALIDRLPSLCSGEVLGILQIEDAADLTKKDRFFFQKFANRIGYALHNKILVCKNIKHLRFIRSLVKDIEHNIIVPNIEFKLYIKRIQSEVKKGCDLEKEFGSLLTRTDIKIEERLKLLRVVHENMSQSADMLQKQVENVTKHYKNTSLFLETLLRRSHFEKGHYVLNRRSCKIKEDIILPQLEEYAKKIKRNRIEVRDEYDSPDREKPMLVDKGLLAQVYSNLISNAIKYIREVKKEGQSLKYIAYGREILEDYFLKDAHGFKYYLFSTGPHLRKGERDMIFVEGYRGSNVNNAPGTGQGLYFFREIVRVHGGIVGYEPVPYGNRFYFILPPSHSCLQGMGKNYPRG
ncbi:MAG: hypothetical protein BA868_00615 [Desulfobacterales bacterium C00003106]|nr:MAG: hypothetical protein BA868_00615 [Desulfobacterales bacterium C00003106]